MGKEVATRSGGNYLADTSAFYDAFASEVQGLKGGGDGMAFLKFDGNTGDYSYGADDEELPLGSRLAMDPESYARGWVIWVDEQVVHEEMVPLVDGPQPRKSDLPDKGPYEEGDGPVEQFTINFRMIDEPNTGMVFQANNASKRRAMAALLKDYANKFRTQPPRALPIIEIDEREFEAKAKTGKKKYKKHAPAFTIVGWMTREEADALVGPTPEDDDAPAPKGTKRLAAPKEDDAPPARRRRAEPEPEDDAPPARRRRAEPEPEDDEPPARRRRAEPEPEDDEPPARRRRAEPEPEDDEPPARRRRAEPEPEDDEPPARRTASRVAAAEDEEDEAPPRRSGRTAAAAPADEEEDDEPAPARRRRAEPEAEEEEAPPKRRGRF